MRIHFLFLSALLSFSACQNNSESNKQEKANADSSSLKIRKQQILPKPEDTITIRNFKTVLVPVQDPNGFLWGLKDTVINKLTLDYKYEYIYPFVEGRARVKFNGKYGFIDTTGNEIVPPHYELVVDFKKGYGEVGDYGNTQIIDYSGQYVFPGMFYNSHTLMPEFNRVVLGTQGNGAALYDLKGNTIIPVGRYQYIRLIPEGMCIVSNRDSSGITDLDGNIVLPMVFRHIENFNEGRAFVQKSNLYGLIDENANELFYNCYDRAWAYINGFAKVMKNHKTGFINKHGKVVIPLIYDWSDYGAFFEGLSPVSKKGKFGYVDTVGNVRIPLIYVSANNFRDGLAEVRKEGYGQPLGMVDHDGNEVIPCIHREIRRLSDKFIVGNHNGKSILYDFRGKVIDTTFEEINGPFDYGNIFIFKKHSKYGALDMDLKVIVPPIYELLAPIGTCLLKASKDQKVHFLDMNGKIAFPLVCDYVEDDFTEGIAKVIINNKTGLINLSGKLVVPARYDDIYEFQYGLALVQRNNKFGVIDLKGREVIPATYDDISISYEYLRVTKGDESFNFDRSGKLLEDEGGC